ncbi:MAG: molybdenum cofactor guanylyltransferase [Gammaproteobacteria bacterium]|nr:MAG: molybdenum cofactor guanylyltransferase [Gammaproteobacteria bacterium]
MITSPTPSITGVILAGGQARRMGGEDKGLILFHQQPLIRYAIDALASQVDSLVINANRNIDRYQSFGYPVISDTIDGFCGPLAGMLSAMQSADTDYILTSPCDCPSISAQLRQRLMESLLLSPNADIAVAFDGQRLQPVFSLIPCHMQDDLQAYLLQGDRKIDLWFQRHKLTVVDFSDQPETFLNFNRPEDLAASDIQLKSAVPLLGFSAFSGTGKTTLLKQLLPLLNQQGLNVAVIKHAHHKFDIDKPGKDSYELRKAGAKQMLIASSNLMALMETQPSTLDEPRLAELLPRLDNKNLDLILVEGFKQEAIPKIELHRPSLGKPLLHPDDANIIAIASDELLTLTTPITQLDLNDAEAMIDFIQHHIENWKT